jgi:putative FmdB family regulatory protein
MPIYEYRCQQCGQLTDALQKMSDPPLRTCRSCGAEALEKVMSRTSFHLKGTGWYVTDYKSSGGGGTGGSGAGGDASGGDAASSGAAARSEAPASPAPTPAASKPDAS